MTQKTLLLLCLSTITSTLACATTAPAPEDTEPDQGEVVAEAESAVVTYCISTCGCELGYACIIFPGQWYGTCERDGAGPPAPVCYEDCQCPSGQLCGPWMICQEPVCATDCDCVGGSYCYRGQCLDDPYSSAECTQSCQCEPGETCQDGQCHSGGHDNQPR